VGRDALHERGIAYAAPMAALLQHRDVMPSCRLPGKLERKKLEKRGRNPLRTQRCLERPQPGCNATTNTPLATVSQGLSYMGTLARSCSGDIMAWIHSSISEDECARKFSDFGYALTVNS